MRLGFIWSEDLYEIFLNTLDISLNVVVFLHTLLHTPLKRKNQRPQKTDKQQVYHNLNDGQHQSHNQTKTIISPQRANIIPPTINRKKQG